MKLGLPVLVVGVIAIAFSFTALANTVQLSVAQGNVYDIYGCAFSGSDCTIVAACQNFNEIKFFEVGNAGEVYSLSIDAKCGPVVMVTATTTSGTTFASANPLCPPGYAQESGRTCVPTGSSGSAPPAPFSGLPTPAANLVRFFGVALTLAGVVLVVVGKRRGERRFF